MVTGNLQEDGDKKSKGIHWSWGTTVSGQSVSTSGRVGSPSSRSEAGMATPVRDITALRLSNLANQGDDSASQRARRKKRGERATDIDKNDRGLRHLSMKVCEKVKSKGRTTYNEVADELVAEYASIALGTEGDDKKNIRRRVYDALNVLTAMHIISKDKKEIQWRGFPRTSSIHIEELKTERVALEKRIEKKAAYLRELEEQFTGYANLIQRNQQLYGNGTAPSGHVTLPFILAQKNVRALIDMKLEKHKNLGEECRYFWKEITFKFDRKESEVAALKQLTQQDRVWVYGSSHLSDCEVDNSSLSVFTSMMFSVLGDDSSKEA